MPSRKKKPASPPELVIITGLSGSGKGTVLRAFEDLGFYSVDNLPVDLIPTFAELTRQSPDIRRAALVVDVREGSALDRFPDIYRSVSATMPARLLFLEADDTSLVRRFSETRRPHPLARPTVKRSIDAERRMLETIRTLADLTINTSLLTVHQLRRMIEEQFSTRGDGSLSINVLSFGFRNGVPADADVVFDVRFLPNPHYVPELRAKNGKDPDVAAFVRGFPQTQEFIDRVSGLLEYLIPHYIQEGKSYLTIAFGCTGGHHRSVMIAEQVRERLTAAYRTAVSHRDIEKPY
jgi:UPF0042 nucleotide-binding protein